MQLTKFTDYALRVLIFLAKNQGKRVTIDDLASHYHVSRNHLMKIVHNLSVAGFIHSSRGRSGGLSLGMSADKITIADVVSHTEKNLELVECFESGSTCMLESDCVLKYVLHRAMGNFMEVLKLFTLADILERQNMLAASPINTIKLPVQ